MPDLLSTALESDRVILSVVGAHAGESERDIFKRKLEDVNSVGNTFWLYRSPSARPDLVQSFLSELAFVLFLAPSNKSGARPTTVSDRVAELSRDKAHWQPVPIGISPITGKLPAYAFVFSELETCSSEMIDLWQYETDLGSSVRFRLGMSTLLTRHALTLSTAPMKSRFRRVFAVGKLVPPHAVWVR